MAIKSKKKVKTNTKQKQKQTQKQNVVVNINTTKTTKKKSSNSKKNNKAPETNRPLRPTAETAYNRVITQSQPMLIQQIPNNNDLIGAIQQIANKFQQPTAPVQFNPALFENTVNSLNELNETLKKKPTEKLRTFSREKPKRDSNDTVYNIDLTQFDEAGARDDGAGVFSMLPFSSPKKDDVKSPSVLSRIYNSAKKPFQKSSISPPLQEITSSLVFGEPQAKTNEKPQKMTSIPPNYQPIYRKDDKKLWVINPITGREIDAYGEQAKKLKIGIHKPPKSYE